MSTQELHIELDILLQKVNSSWNKDFLSQEYDLLLNKEIGKFIKQRINPLSNDKHQSIFDIIQRVQNLNPLLRTVPLPIIPVNQKEVKVLLPFDFLGYIGSGIDAIYTCDTSDSQTVDVTSYTCSITPIKTLGVNINNLSNISIYLTYVNKNQVVTTVNLFKLSDLPAGYLPQDDMQDYLKYFIYDNAINKVVTKALKDINNLSLEPIEFRFNNATSKFEFKSASDINIVYSINAQVQSTTKTTSTSFFLTGNDGFDSPVSIVDEEFKSFIKVSNLSNSTVDNTKGYLRERELYIYKPNGVSIKGLNLTYICKPIQIDLLLNIDSELPDSVLTEIVSNTAQSLKGIISSDTYEKYTRENTLIE